MTFMVCFIKVPGTLLSTLHILVHNPKGRWGPAERVSYLSEFMVRSRVEVVCLQSLVLNVIIY